MKKKLTTFFSSLVLVTLMLALLAGCSSYSSIKSAFQKAGYSESQSIEEYQDDILKCLNANSEEEIKSICTVHVFTKPGTLLPVATVAIVFEFSSTDKMKETIEKSAMLKGAIKDIQNSDYVNENCVLLPLATRESVEIFKKA